MLLMAVFAPLGAQAQNRSIAEMSGDVSNDPKTTQKSSV